MLPSLVHQSALAGPVPGARACQKAWSCPAGLSLAMGPQAGDLASAGSVLLNTGQVLALRAGHFHGAQVEGGVESRCAENRA